MRILVALAMFLAALLSLNSTLALESAQVTNKASGITVTNTSAAILGLTPGTGTGNAAQTAYISPTTGALVLDFSRGKGDSPGYGFVANQAGAAYRDLVKYKGLFTVTNNSVGESLCISVYVPSGGMTDLEAVYLRLSGETGNGWKVAQEGGTYFSCRPNVPVGSQVLVDFWWRVATTESGVGSTSFDVWVEGKRQSLVTP